MKNYYTGIGSRQTPQHILQTIKKLATILNQQGFILRSGGAEGADTAFAEATTNKEIYLPWPNFNNTTGINVGNCPKARNIAQNIHPAWNKCSQGAQKLHTRNIYQILGKDLQTPSQFIICWTKNGQKTGGTATALTLAEQHHIPIINLFHPNHPEILKETLKQLIKQKHINQPTPLYNTNNYQQSKLTGKQMTTKARQDF